MKISKIDTNHLRNDAHFQFHTEFRDLVLKHDPQVLKVKPQFDVYLPLYGREDKALKKVNKSAFTEKIKEADAARNGTYFGMVDMNNAMCRHSNRQIAEAAQRIKAVLDTYGNVTKKSLNEETSAIYSMLQDLRSDKYASDARESCIMEWADELEKRNIVLEKLMKSRFDEAAQKSDIVLRAARGELDSAYRVIAKRLDALAAVEGTANYGVFIRTLNAVISKYSVKHRRHVIHGQPKETAA
jgi:hypothetical protein